MKKLFVLLALVVVGSFASGCGRQNTAAAPVAPGMMNPYGAGAYGAYGAYPANCVGGQCTCPNPQAMQLQGQQCMVNPAYNGWGNGNCASYGQNYYWGGMQCLPQGIPSGAYYYPQYGGYVTPYSQGMQCTTIYGGAFVYCLYR